MRILNTVCTTASSALIAVFLGAGGQAAGSGPATSTPNAFDTNPGCAASGPYGFVCGPQNAEDLVQVPGTPWIIASGMAPGAAIYLVHSERKTWSTLYPAGAVRDAQDMKTYSSCPGAPDPDNFITHGLNLRLSKNGQDKNGHSTLYVVSHGGREAVEVFDVDATGAQPALTWTGCVLMPRGREANSVASFNDGTLLATVEVLPDRTMRDVLVGEPTGAVYQWSPGESGFHIVPGTALPGNNGIEVSADETKFFVVSEGLRTIVAFGRGNPARRLGATRPMEFIPDNIHLQADGRLLTAGTINDEPACGGAPDPEDFDLAAFAACPRGFMAAIVDPETMHHEVIAAGPAIPEFSNVTMAMAVGKEIWLGTFAGDRIAYVPVGNGR